MQEASVIKPLGFIFAHSTFYCATAVTGTGVICLHFVAGEREKGETETDKEHASQQVFLPITGVLRSMTEI